MRRKHKRRNPKKRHFIKSQQPHHVVLQPNPVLQQRLKSLMDEQGLNGSTLTQKVRRGYTCVYDILSGKSKRPLPEIIVALADALGVTAAYLTGASDDRDADWHD